MCAIHKLGKSRDVPGGDRPAGSHPVETVPLGGTGSRSSCSSGCNSSPDRSPPRRLGRRQNVLQCASGPDALRGKLAWSVLGGRGDPRQRSELGWRTSASPPSPWAATHFGQAEPAGGDAVRNLALTSWLTAHSRRVL